MRFVWFCENRYVKIAVIVFHGTRPLVVNVDIGAGFVQFRPKQSAAG